ASGCLISEGYELSDKL
nr:T cell receptor delta 5 {V-D-J junction} [mice, intestinal intraepithelial lymphocytes, Peptide Partial, 16 aa] [Mus sp.]